MTQALDDLASLGVLVLGVGDISKAKFNEYYHLVSRCSSFKVMELPLAQKHRMRIAHVHLARTNTLPG